MNRSEPGQVRYELTVTAEEARSGSKKVLVRNNKRLEVSIPPGVQTGSAVKLTNALQLTDGRPGDILISIEVKEEAPPPPAGVIEISDSNFESEVLNSALPVAVDFWAAWCGPCRQIAPIMEKLADEYRGRCKFCKLNVDENRQSAARYQAMSIPLLLLFKNGEVVDRSVGAVPESALRPKIEALL